MHDEYIARHSIHKVGIGGICSHNNQVLFVKHKYGISKGKWILPGGYVEIGESLSKAVEREIFEETGIITQAIDLVAVRHMINEKEGKGLISDIYIVFRVEYKGGKLVADNKEVSKAKFLSFEKISSYEISNLSKYVIDHFLEKKGFSLISYDLDKKIEETLHIHNYELYG